MEEHYSVSCKSRRRGLILVGLIATSSYALLPMPASLYHLIYSSDASSRFSRQSLVDFLTQSRAFNSKHRISGLLVYAGGNFVQLLEGPEGKIKELMGLICLDARHHDVRVLEEGPLSKRQFADWSMAFLDFASSQVRALPGYSTYLDAPVGVEDFRRGTSRSLHLLHYFKAIMAVSEDSLLHLAETIHAAPARSGIKTKSPGARKT